MGSWIALLIDRFKAVLDNIRTVFNIGFAGFYKPLELQHQDLTGKVALVTGANSGLGYSIALTLAKQNATVFLACRSRSRGETAAAEIINLTGSKNVQVVELDTSSLASVREFATSWSKPIDILMHNAGITTAPLDLKVTPEGLGLIYATNHAGPFLLTALLESKLAPNARVVFTSSTGAYLGSIGTLFEMPRLVPQSRSDSQIYNDTKLMQVAFARALQQRWSGLGMRATAHAFTPGFSMTPILDKMHKTNILVDPLYWVLRNTTRLAISSEQGALTGVWLAMTNDLEVIRGGDFWDRFIKRRTPIDFLSPGKLERIWQLWCIDSGAQWD
ncbi:MAG: hypothetical protein GOMPHAMPRED_003799 [Gomphillus americanus]|uniref:NAD(P)-binding protein n=1 Tax=Gomphillus americanus TaxID=1940652 RepID=A0A8H3FIA6_9LECA|nr:MAG: hypothetical protein GOMPHAMPRED_003799 [Gomphillus americanus]